MLLTPRSHKKESSLHLDARLKVMMRGSMKEKLPPALIINSTNLRVMDPIGQGILVAILILLTQHNVWWQVSLA